MATHEVRTYHWPPLIDDERFSRNGMVPNAALAKKLAENFNFISHRCKKQIIAHCQPFDAVQSNTSGISNLWPTYFRTGEASTALRLAFGLALPNTALPAVTPNFAIRDETAAAAFTDITFEKGAPTGGTTEAIPSTIIHVDRLITGLTPNNEYSTKWTAATGGIRIVYFSLTEEPGRVANDATTGVCNPGEFVAEGPIYDAHFADLIDASNKLWRHNGAHLITALPYFDYGTGFTTSVVTSTSYVNVLDGASTTVTDATPGWKLYTQYHNTTNRTTIPVKFAYCADRTSAAGTLSLKLTDGTNSIEVTGIGDLANAWTATTSTIPAQNGTKWDLHAKVSAGVGASFRFLGASLFEHEA